MKTGPIITLTTDFGDRDGFVGTMKGVMLSICPNARFVDISHDVPRQDVIAGAMVLRNACGFFPDGTVHLAVIDPGVGTTRHAMVAVNDWGVFVLPDNGLVDAVSREAPLHAVHRITNQALCLPQRSNTFHGRDVFAPVAAHLAKGLPIENVGPALSRWKRLDWPEPSVAGRCVAGEVVYIDTFGNLFTNLREENLALLSRPWRLKVGDRVLDGPQHAYGDVPPGQLCFLWGSSGYLEIAENGGNAAKHYGIDTGTPVQLESLL